MRRHLASGCMTLLVLPWYVVMRLTYLLDKWANEATPEEQADLLRRLRDEVDDMRRER